MMRCTCLLLITALCSTTRAAPATRPMPLSAVKTFMYQLENLDEPAQVNALAKSSYDMLVVEPTATDKEASTFNMKAMVAQLHAGKPGRIVMAYLNVGEAEKYRAYWLASWKAPTKTTHGIPSFLLIPDPDGWPDNYPLAYWDTRWQAIIATNPDSQVKQLMRAGFDGVYLDWIDAWSDDVVDAEATRQHLDPGKAMVDFIALIRTTARSINPAALVIQQNAFDLIDEEDRLVDCIDGLGVEDTWFSGKPDAPWESAAAGDMPNRDTDESSTADRLKQYGKFLAAGKPVFTIDYCVKSENAARVYAASRANHLVPLVTRVSLDRMTTTPPTVGR